MMMDFGTKRLVQSTKIWIAVRQDSGQSLMCAEPQKQGDTQERRPEDPGRDAGRVSSRSLGPRRPLSAGQPHTGHPTAPQSRDEGFWVRAVLHQPGTLGGARAARSSGLCVGLNQKSVCQVGQPLRCTDPQM